MQLHFTIFSVPLGVASLLGGMSMAFSPFFDIERLLYALGFYLLDLQARADTSQREPLLLLPTT